MDAQVASDPAPTCEPINHAERPASGHFEDRGDHSRLSETFRASIDGYGAAEVAASGVDRSRLRRNLQLTPTERVEQMVAFVRFVLPLQGTLHHKKK
jgi:hypothetical protein